MGPAPGGCEDELDTLCALFTPKAKVNVQFEASHEKQINATNKARIFTVIRRHPRTLEDLVAELDSERSVVEKIVEGLINDGLISKGSNPDRIQYTAKQPVPFDAPLGGP